MILLSVFGSLLGAMAFDCDKYASWLGSTEGELINLFMDYETFGEHQPAETGIFDFLSALPEQIYASTDFEFLTPHEAVLKHQPVAPLNVPYPISWADEEKRFNGLAR